MDLADSLAVKDIETRYVKQVVREEAQINVASGQFAKGLTVKETAVKTLRPQTSLRGCLNWLRAVTSRVDRGLHMDIEKVRSTNGAGLVLAQIFAKGQHAFISGLGNGNWERMVAQPDITLQKIPPEIAKSRELKNEYAQRGTRPSSFYAILLDISELDFLPSEFLEKVRERLQKRDPNRLRDFSEAEIVNVGLVSDILERYRKLLDDFTAMVAAGDAGTDLAALFNLLTQGIDFPEMKKALIPFTLENKRSRIDNKRVLINELRIFLSRQDEKARSDFKSKLTPLVIRARLMQDPLLYRKAVMLELADPEETEGLSVARQLYRSIYEQVEGIDASRVNPEAPAPAELKQKMFEMLVALTYQGEFSVNHRENMVPKKAKLARMLIGCFAFKSFNPAQLRSLNPKLPVKGVAQNLTGKTPFTMMELLASTKRLNQALFPLVQLAAEISKNILVQYKDQAAQRSEAALNTYLNGAYPLLRNTNYLLGKAGQTPVMYGATAAAGKKLGLTLLTSRDETKDSLAQEKIKQKADEGGDGYVSLMSAEGKRFFPLKADLDFISRAYRYLYGEQVASLVRRLVSKKINFLLDLHGNRLFEAIYQHLVWDHQMTLSRYQTGMILFRRKVFEPQRLKEFGFRAGAMGNGHNRDNPWLHTKDEESEEGRGEYPYVRGRIEKEYQAAFQALNGLVKKIGEQAKTNGSSQKPNLASIIAEKCRQGLFDPFDADFREAMAGCDAAAALWIEIQETTAKDFQAIVPKDTEGEALEFTLPGPLAFLTLLKDSNTFKINDKDYLFRLKSGWDMKGNGLDSASQAMAKGLSERLAGTGGSESVRLVKPTLELLQSYCNSWSNLRRIAEVVLIDQILQETILTLAKPSPPDPGSLRKLPPESMLCLGMSSADSAKFHRVNARTDTKGSYATLSQLASWLETFPRLRREMDDIRAIATDVLEIIASFNISVFDAPYVLRLATKLRELEDALGVRPEDMIPQDLERIQKSALEIEAMRREFFEKESDFPPKDRWLNRITIRLRKVRPATDLGFGQVLYERTAKVPQSSEEEADATSTDLGQKKEQFQTFSERARNVIQYRRHVQSKAVFVLSPGNTQRRLTINVIDQLFRLKGIFTPVLADISGCEVFVDELRTRLPPHRLFDMNQL